MADGFEADWVKNYGGQQPQSSIGKNCYALLMPAGFTALYAIYAFNNPDMTGVPVNCFVEPEGKVCIP